MDTSDSQGNGVAKPVGSQPNYLPPSVTTVAFDPIIPLLRVPVPAGTEDDPSKGLFVLAFKDEESWRHAWYNCETKIAEQCEVGARMGCSIYASKKCQPPWWIKLLPFRSKSEGEMDQREACEQREMQCCLADAKDKCANYAEDTCKTLFSEARIADQSLPVHSKFQQNCRHVKRLSRKDALKLVHRIGKATQKLSQSESSLFNFDAGNERKTNFQGKVLLKDEPPLRTWEQPLWVDGTVHGLFTEREELTGWEGGLIWPKTCTQKVESPDGDGVRLADGREQTFWKHCKKVFRDIMEQWKLQ